MLAQKIPEMEIDEAEAAKIATAYAHVAEFYPILQSSPKSLAIMELLSVTGTIYGMRIVAMYNNRTKKPEAETPQGPVLHFPPRQPGL